MTAKKSNSDTPKRLSPFDFINAINAGKNIMDNDNEREYHPFLVNKGLSYFTDTILYANEMNIYPSSDHRLQFDYLINSIRPSKTRYTKWAKGIDDLDILAVREYYGYDISKAKDALSVLSQDQIKRIKERLDKGG